MSVCPFCYGTLASLSSPCSGPESLKSKPEDKLQGVPRARFSQA